MDYSFPRLLLVTTDRPGCGSVGQILLGDLCLACPRERVACFAMPFRKSVHNANPELESIPVRTAVRRYESPYRFAPGRLGMLSAVIDSAWRLERHTAKLVEQAVHFGREQRAEKVWMVLDTVTAIAMGSRIAEELNIPLICLVWDAPEYVLGTAGLDRLTRRRLLKRFGETLRCAERVAVVSDAMAHKYHDDYGARCVLLRHGLPADVHRTPVDATSQRSRFVLGFAGGMYAHSAWNSLLDALDQIAWRLGDRPVVVRVTGPGFGFHRQAPVYIEYLGWRPPRPDTVDILASCDANYLPQPFEPTLSDLARYSFPTKLSSYVAAGRPVLIHAPSHASLIPFHQRFPIGPCCTSLGVEEIIASLQSLVAPPEYARAAQSVQRVARTELSQETYLQRFAEFVGVNRGSLTTPV